MAGAVAVGAVVSVMGGLSHVVARMKREYPALDVRLVGAKSIELAAQVESGELDAAMLVQGAGRLPGTLVWTPLYQEPLVAIAGRDSLGANAREALAANPSCVSTADSAPACWLSGRCAARICASMSSSS